MTTTPVAIPARSTLARSVLAKLDRSHIDRVAHDTARRIVWADSAIAVLDPGDQTVYEVTMIRTDEAGIVVDHRLTRPAAPRPHGYDWFTVGVNQGRARPARWNATVAPSDDEVLASWWGEPYRHDFIPARTGVVLATFLQVLAVHYVAERANQTRQEIF